MWVLKWAVLSRSRHSLQTIDEAGPKESQQPQWGAAAARPEIRGLPHRSIQGPANSASDLEPLNRDRSFFGVGSCSDCPTFKFRGTLASLVNWTGTVNPSLPSVKKLRGIFWDQKVHNCSQSTTSTSSLKSQCWLTRILSNTSPYLPLNTTTSLKSPGRSTTTCQRRGAALGKDRAVISWPTPSMSTGPSFPSPKAGHRRAQMNFWWRCTALWKPSGEYLMGLSSPLWHLLTLVDFEFQEYWPFK